MYNDKETTIEIFIFENAHSNYYNWLLKKMNLIVRIYFTHLIEIFSKSFDSRISFRTFNVFTR